MQKHFSFFFDQFDDFGERTALICEDGSTLTFAELAQKVRSFKEQLQAKKGGVSGLLVLAMENDPDAVTAYLGALAARWPVLLLAPDAVNPEADLLRRFKPDLIWRRGSGLIASDIETPDGKLPSHSLHPDLALMLSTSGSTGSSKLVRLSRVNLHANAASIAEYLDLGPGRVAATTLPLHYTYGLSILHSVLLSGGTVALTAASVTDPAFRPFIERAGVTDLAGVPYTYELFERLGLRENPPATLKILTQAGGRLPADLVARYADFAQERGMKFFVMYGQTEATARMAWLPPELAARNTDCIGLPIPGGRFEIRDEAGQVLTDPDVTGELIYHGPNVMMGYALAREDLARGAELSELATGDLAERTADGLYRIVGRASRFSKLAGLRIGHDEVERIMREAGISATVIGDDRVLLLAIHDGKAEASAELVAKTCRLPLSFIHAWHEPVVPRLASGKIDYNLLRHSGLARFADAQAERLRRLGQVQTIAAIYAQALNQPSPPPEASFASLGGDSLAYVAASIGIEDLLGSAPDGWEGMSIAELQRLANDAPLAQKPRSTIGTDVLLRLLAISLVFLGHGMPQETEFLRGGSGILFLLAGFGMAQMQMPQLLQGRIAPLAKGMFQRLILPYMLLVTAMLLASPAAKSISWYTLSSVLFLTEQERGPLFSFWFIETLIHCTVLMWLLFLWPDFRRAMVARPYGTLMALAIFAGVLNIFGRLAWPNGDKILLTLDGWLYIFVLGWAVVFAKTTVQKVLILGLTTALSITQFGIFTGRPWWLAICLILLFVVPQLKVDRRVAGVVVTMATASYFMYLLHPLVVHVFRFSLSISLPPLVIMALVYLGSLGAGVVAHQIWRKLSRLLHSARSDPNLDEPRNV